MKTNPLSPAAHTMNRRMFLHQASMGLGTAALNTLWQPSLLGEAGQAPNTPGTTGFPNLPVKAKRVIFLCMAGGPSHLETFDPKPTLAELDGKPMPESFTKGQPIASYRERNSSVWAP